MSLAGNGLCARSAPIVLSGPWPLMKVMVSSSVSIFVVDRAHQGRMSPPGRSVRPTEPWNSTSPTRQNCIGSLTKTTLPGRMAGTMAHVEAGLAECHVVALLQPAVGRDVAAGEAEARRRRFAGCRAGTCRRDAGPSMGTPRSSRNSAAPPAWSAWPWVRRIFSTLAPVCSMARRISGTSPPGSTTAALFRRFADQNGAILLKRRDRNDGDLDLRHEVSPLPAHISRGARRLCQRIAALCRLRKPSRAEANLHQPTAQLSVRSRLMVCTAGQLLRGSFSSSIDSPHVRVAGNRGGCSPPTVVGGRRGRGSNMNRYAYHFFEMAQLAMAPARALSDFTRMTFKNPINPMTYTAVGRNLAASAELFERMTRRYGKPAFGLDTTHRQRPARSRSRRRSSGSGRSARCCISSATCRRRAAPAAPADRRADVRPLRDAAARHGRDLHADP